jgi:hypothetical protein
MISRGWLIEATQLGRSPGPRIIATRGDGARDAGKSGASLAQLLSPGPFEAHGVTHGCDSQRRSRGQRHEVSSVTRFSGLAFGRGGQVPRATGDARSVGACYVTTRRSLPHARVTEEDGSSPRE